MNRSYYLVEYPKVADIRNCRLFKLRARSRKGAMKIREQTLPLASDSHIDILECENGQWAQCFWGQPKNWEPVSALIWESLPTAIGVYKDVNPRTHGYELEWKLVEE